MGLFPEIGRAWLTIDSDIYVSEIFKIECASEIPHEQNFSLFLDLDIRALPRCRLFRWFESLNC